MKVCIDNQGGVLEHIAEAKQTCNTNHPKNHLQGDHTKNSWKVGLEGNNRATFGSSTFFLSDQLVLR